MGCTWCARSWAEAGSVLAALLWGTAYAVPFLLMTRPVAGLLLAVPWGFAAEVWMYENPAPVRGIHGVLCLITLIAAVKDRANRRRLWTSTQVGDEVEV